MFKWKEPTRIFITAKKCGLVTRPISQRCEDIMEVCLVSIKKQGMLHPAGSAVIAISELHRSGTQWHMQYLIAASDNFRKSLHRYMRSNEDDSRHLLVLSRVSGSPAGVYIFATNEKQAAEYAHSVLKLQADEYDGDHWSELAHVARTRTAQAVCKADRRR